LVKVAICGSGPSLDIKTVNTLLSYRNSGVIDMIMAISDAGIMRIPEADVLVSHDTSWWMANPGAFNFKGDKWSSRGVSRTRAFETKGINVFGGMNSGLFAMFIARDEYTAKKIFLFGFEMHRRNGQHFFGPHTAKYGERVLKNTDEKTFKIHARQFDRFSGCEVFNCTKDSDLKRFPFLDISDIIKT
jgi:hypothetical protein